MKHVIITFEDEIRDRLKEEAKRKGITVNSLIRAVIVGEWIEKHEQ